MKALSFLFLFLISCLMAHSVTIEGFPPSESHTYKSVDGVDLELDVFYPEGHQSGDSRPAIVFFFGGGWTKGSPSQFYPYCQYLASRGMVAISASYRVESRNNTTPAEALKDAKSAIRWVRQHAKELGIDPDRIAAGGGSAGGHLAAATGTTDGFEEDGEDLSVSSRPAALVLFNPVYDNGPGGYGHGRVKAYWEAFSPMHNLSEQTPPTLVMLGSKDNLVSVETAEEYKALMESHGVRSELVIYEGQPHGFFNYNRNPAYYVKTAKEMDRFLASLGYLEGEPTLGDKPNEPTVQ